MLRLLRGKQRKALSGDSTKEPPTRQVEKFKTELFGWLQEKRQGKFNCGTLGRAVSVMTIHRGVKQLGLTSDAQGKRHLLTNRMKEVRLIKCKKLLNWMRPNGSVIKFFSDEKIFTVDWSANRRNDRWIASSSSELHHTMTTKKPASVMAICGI